MIRRTPRSTLLPYTTLFLSAGSTLSRQREQLQEALRRPAVALHGELPGFLRVLERSAVPQHRGQRARIALDHRLRRSEEHTSELQSRQNIVCRLLLEEQRGD